MISRINPRRALGRACLLALIWLLATGYWLLPDAAARPSRRSWRITPPPLPVRAQTVEKKTPATRPDPRKMTFPTLEVKLPKPDRVQLANGLVVYVMEDHALPLIAVNAIVRTGTIYEPDAKAGLAEMTAALIRTGGAGAWTADQFDEELEFIDTQLGSSASYESGRVSLSTLKAHADRSLELMASMLREPRFDPQKLEIYRQAKLESIRRRNDEPGEIARREFRRLVYAQHPISRIPFLKTVQAITREDVVDFYRRAYRPEGIILAISGDIGRDEAVRKLEALLGGWKPTGEPLPPVPTVAPSPTPGVYFISKPVPQASIRMGHLGLHMTDPDYPAVQVMNEILGGGAFSARMMREIRSNRGLAYGAYSFFWYPSRMQGMFAGLVQTKNESAGQVIALMKELIQGMTQQPVADDELKTAKDAILNSYVFEFKNAGEILGRQVALEFDGLPKDFLEAYPRAIAKVGKADVLTMAKKYLHPEQMVMIVVGDEKAFDKPLSTFGPVKTLTLEL